jgi:hypothetical protein
VITEYHAKFFAYELSKQHSVADAEKLAGASLDAQIACSRKHFATLGVDCDLVTSLSEVAS